MERLVVPLPSGVGENREIVIVPLGESDDEVATNHQLVMAALRAAAKPTRAMQDGSRTLAGTRRTG